MQKYSSLLGKHVTAARGAAVKIIKSFRLQKTFKSNHKWLRSTRKRNFSSSHLLKQYILKFAQYIMLQLRWFTSPTRKNTAEEQLPLTAMQLAAQTYISLTAVEESSSAIATVL